MYQFKHCLHRIHSSCAAAGRIWRLCDARTKNAVQIVFAHLCSELDKPTDDIDVNDSSEPSDISTSEKMSVTNTNEDDIKNGNNHKDPELENVQMFPTQVDFG